MTNKEIDPKNIPEISEDYKFLDFEKTIQDISEKITALKNSAIDSSELNNQINTLRKERDLPTRICSSHQLGKMIPAFNISLIAGHCFIELIGKSS